MPTSPLPPGSTVAAYYRDSGGTEQERSIDQQRAAATEYCRQHGLVLVREFADEATPGSSVIGRDGFLAMVAWLRELAPEPERGKRQSDAPDAVLCWDMKRFSRDDRDSAFFRADLRRRGYSLLFISDRIPAGDMAPVFEAMLSWKAKQDLEELAKDVRRGIRARVMARGPDGRYLNLWPARAPVGFRPEPCEFGHTRAGLPRIAQRIVPDRGGTWDRVRVAFELRASGTSMKRIHRETRLYATGWGYRAMYRRRIYYGDLEWGGEIIEGWIEPCVSRETWEAVEQRRVHDAERSLPPRTGTGRYALSGWLRCGICDGRMSGATSTVTKPDGTFYLYRRYKCTTASMTMNTHTNFYPSAWDVEREVYRILTEWVLTPDALFSMLEGTSQGGEERDALLADVKRLCSEVEGLDRQISRLVDQVERFGPDQFVARRLQERRRQKRKAESELASVRRRAKQAEPEPVPEAVIRAFCENATEILLTGDVEEVRAVLGQILEIVVIWPDGRGLVRYVVAIGDHRGSVQEAEFRWCGD